MQQRAIHWVQSETGMCTRNTGLQLTVETAAQPQKLIELEMIDINW